MKKEMTSDVFEKLRGKEIFIFIYGKLVCRDMFDWTCTIDFVAKTNVRKNGDTSTAFINKPGYNKVTWSKPD